MRISEVLALAASLAVSVSGCKDAGLSPISQDGAKDAAIWAVTVGMERSAFAGGCPGAAYDERRMRRLLGSVTPNVRSLSDESATLSAVSSALSEAADNAELLIFYYSGHGGQIRYADTDEPDGLDEVLCLYDSPMRDDSIWRIVSRCRGRVFCIFDACHSQTMFRLPRPKGVGRAAMPLSSVPRGDGGVRLLAWSGCPDDSVSYGGSNGGQLTNAILRHLRDGMTYDELWEKVAADGTLLMHQRATRTDLGEGFGGEPAFR